MQVRCLNLQRICLLSAKWPQLLGNRRTNSYKSAGIRWWVSWAEHTWENQSKYDGRCTVCLRDVPRLLSLTLCQIIDHQQPCNPPKGHRAEFRPPASIWILSSPRTRVVYAINSLLVAHSQTTGEQRCGSKGIKVENVLLVHHENYRLSWWAPPGPDQIN